MGKLNDSLLEGSSGKVGRLVVANVFGVDILKKRPRAKKGVASDSQLLVEERMKSAIRFMTPYRDFACIHFGQRRKLCSRYNFAMQNVLKALAIDYVQKTITPHFEDILFSEGNLLGIYALGMTSPEARELRITWSDNSGSDPVSETDQLQILIAEEDSFRSHFLKDLAPRSAGTVDIPITIDYAGKDLHVYATFKSADNLAVATSTYLGSINVPA